MFFALYLAVCALGGIEATLQTSSCTLTTVPSSLTLGSQENVLIDCSVVNSGSADQPFYLLLSAPQDVPRGLLSYPCSSSVCPQPAINISITASSQLVPKPQLKTGLASEGVLAVFEGVVTASSTLSTQVQGNLYVGNLYVSDTSDLTLSVYIKESLSSSTALAEKDATIQVSEVPSLSSLGTLRSGRYLRIGENDRVTFTTTATPSSSNTNPSVIEMYSNYLLEIYRVTIGGSTIAANPQMTEISANSEINSPCVSDLCNINTRPLYKYTIDVSTSCCPKNTANSIEVEYYIYETPTNDSNVFVEVYLRLVTPDVPLYVAGRYFETFPVNPGLSISKIASVATEDISPQVFGIQVVVTNQSPLNIYNATVSDDVNSLMVLENSNKKTPTDSEWTEVDSKLVATMGSISPADSNLVYSYDVSLFGSGESFPSGKQWRQVSFTYYMISEAEAINGYLGKQYVISPECPLCFEKDFQSIVSTKEVYDFVIVAILICFILGFLLMFLILTLMVLCMGFSAVVTISPVADEESLEDRERRMRKDMREKRRAARQKRREIRSKNKEQVTKSAVLMKKMKLYFLGSKEAYDSALSSLTSTTSVDYENCSLVQILSIEDAEKTEKEISCCDIGESIGLDKKVDQYRVQSMILVITLLLKSMVESKSIDSQLSERLIKKVQLNVAEMQQSTKKAETLELDKVLRCLKRTHERKIMKLRLKQLDERKYKGSLLKKERKVDRHNVLQILDKQHKKELDELAFVLQLERFHAVENVRKTKAIELRLKIKGAINQVLVEHSPQFSRQCSDLETSGSSLEDKEESAKLEMHLAFLRREFVNHVNNIENGLDSHVTGVKSLMDEKLSWRQHFVSQKQLIIERQRQALNLIAEHIKRFLETQISLGRLEDKDRNVWLTRMSADLVAMREARVIEQGRQTSSLDQLKMTTFSEIRKNHVIKLQEALEAFDNEKIPAIVAGQLDVKKFLEDRFQVITEQALEYGRQQMNHDQECSKEYTELMQSVFEKVYSALETLARAYVKDLKANGCEEEEADALIQQFHRDKERMKLNLEEQMSNLDESQKKQMVKKSKKWQQIRIEEKAAQDTLRQHEERLVKQMVDSKVGLSEGESELQRRLEAEREQLLASVETSVTMKKLQSQLELHQLLYSRREKRLEKLLKAQAAEHLAREERKRLNTDDMTDEEFVKSLISERVHKAVVSLPKAKMREALFQIDEQLMREKLKNIQKQEEKIAAFVVAQELQKARELAKIEEQHQRLIKLKMCLLTEVGVKHSQDKSKDEKKTGAEDTSAAGKLLTQFEQKRKQVDDLLQDEKARQDDKLRHKIAARAQIRQSKAELMPRDSPDTSKNLNDMAKMINEAHSTDFDQTLDEEKFEEMTHKKFHKKKLEALQKQEEEMIASLVDVAGLSSSDLMSVLMTIFPDRSNTELQQMCSRLAVADGGKKTNDQKTADEILPVQSESAEQLRKLIRMEFLSEEMEEAKSR